MTTNPKILRCTKFDVVSDVEIKKVIMFVWWGNINVLTKGCKEVGSSHLHGNRLLKFTHASVHRSKTQTIVLSHNCYLSPLFSSSSFVLPGFPYSWKLRGGASAILHFCFLKFCLCASSRKLLIIYMMFNKRPCSGFRNEKLSSPVRGWQEWVCVWRVLSWHWGPSSCLACSQPAPLWHLGRTLVFHLATVCFRWTNISGHRL